MSDPGVVMMAVSALAAGGYSIRTVASAVLRMREQKLRAADSAVSAISDERIARIEAAVESIAIEVERISEGQRFTTKLLSDNAQPVQAFLPKPGKFDTPH